MKRIESVEEFLSLDIGERSEDEVLEVEVGVEGEGGVNERPVIIEHARRTNTERQRMVRDTFAGREWYVRTSVPRVMTTRLVVMTLNGGSANRTQIGDNVNNLTNNAVSAGRVVAEVAVCCVDTRSVSRMNGSSRTLHLDVKLCSVPTISSRLL